MTDAALPQSEARAQGSIHRKPGGRLWIAAYLAVCAILGFCHLLLGAEPYVVFLALSSILVSALPALFYGWRDLPSLFSLLFCIRYAATALIWKLFEGNPLHEGLYAAAPSFQVILVGTTAVTLAVFCAHIVWRSRPVLQENLNERGFAFLLLLGGALSALSLALSFSDTRLVGGVDALLRNGFVIFPMAYIGFNIYSSKAVFSPGFTLFLIAFTLISVAFNSRQFALTMLLATGVMYICYGFRIGIRTAVVGAVAGLVFAFYIAPAMTDVRQYRASSSPVEMIGYTFDAIGKRLSGEVVTAQIDPDATLYRANYIKAGNHFVERLVSVQQLDFLVALVVANGPIGSERFYRGLYELLPSFIVEDKGVITTPTYALWVYGIFPPGVEVFLESTVYALAFSFGGYEFLFFSVLVGYFLVFLFLRLFAPRLENSIFAAFILVAYIHPLSSGHIWTPYSMVVRSLPFEALMFGLASLISRHKTTEQSA